MCSSDLFIKKFIIVKDLSHLNKLFANVFLLNEKNHSKRPFTFK